MTDQTTRAKEGAKVTVASQQRDHLIDLCTRATDLAEAAESRAASAEADVERLKADLTAAKASDTESLALYRNCRDRLEASASALRDRVAVLESALRPFAEEADSLEDKDCGHLWESPQAMNLTTDHLRAARAALKEPTHV